MKKLNLYLTALLALTAASGAQATTVTLQSLLNGGTISARDKLFADWRIIDQTIVGTDVVVPDYDEIFVTSLDDGGLDPGPGLEINTNSQLKAQGDAGGFSYINLFFGFSVAVTDPNMLIKDVSLSFSGSSITLAGDNGVSVMEQVGTTPASVEDNVTPIADLATINTEFSFLDTSLGGAGLTANASGSANFSPLSKIYVSKDIYVWSGSPNETATLGTITQRFSQVENQVPPQAPEPQVVLLIGVGLMGFAFSVKRRKNQYGA